MELKNLVLILIVLVVLDGIFIADYFINDDSISENNKEELKIVNLGSNDLGSVELIGPIGNSSSDVKIAYIVGVHPLEDLVHGMVYDSLISNSDSLNYSYYVYRVNVTENPDSYEEGRINGQYLANEFVVPHINSSDYDLVVDVHSHQGPFEGTYGETNFIFSPIVDDKSNVIIEDILSNSPHLMYFFPVSQSSPTFVTIPIIESGTPAIIFELYDLNDESLLKDYAQKLIKAVDNINFK